MARLSSAKAATAVRVRSLPPKLSRRQLFYFSMLTKDEQQFLEYWRVQRTKKRIAGARLGFRLAVLVVLGIFISIVTGWHKEAMMELRSDSSTILVIVIAAAAIVVFITLFSANYQWEQREQHYKELEVKKAAEARRDNAKTENGG